MYQRIVPSDERLGWTGDTQIFAATASYNMDTCAFYTKHMKDLRLEQEKLDGGIPFVVPYLKTVSATSGLRRHSSCAWGISRRYFHGPCICITRIGDFWQNTIR